MDEGVLEVSECRRRTSELVMMRSSWPSEPVEIVDASSVSRPGGAASVTRRRVTSRNLTYIH